MEKKLPEFKPLPELGNVASNYMSAFNVGMNIYEALAYLQGYVQITYNSVNDLIDDWNNFETYVTENINQIANEKTQELLNQWLSDGTLAETIKQSDVWNEKVNKTGDVMSGDLQFQEKTGVYGTLHSGTKVNMISHSYTGTDDYTQIGDDNAQAVIHSKNRPVWYDGAQNQDLLVEEDLSPKENLLYNADFMSGIINQRGKLSYKGNQNKNIYTIDKWCVGKHTDLVLTVADGYISISLPNLQWIAQFIEYQPVGAMTVAIKIKGTELKVLSLSNYYVDDDETLKYDFGEIQTNVFVRLYKYPYDDHWQFYILNNTGNTLNLNIEYIKLEKGSVFTGMPQWDFATELLKCLSRFVKISDYRVRQYSTQNTVLIHPLQLPIEMAQKPSITCTASVTTNASEYGVISSNKKCVNLQWNVQSTGVSDLTFDIEADAEIR